LGIAITPDGKSAYVTNIASNNVSVITTATNTTSPTTIPVGNIPAAIAITPDGKTAYVANQGSGTVSVINTQTNQVVGSPITVGALPRAIAIIPNQPPTASFTTAQARPAVPLAFNASASHDSDGQIANYDWDFGDGESAPSAGPSPTHTYAAPGAYKVTLTVSDDEGCSIAPIFSGQTAFCGGSALATATKTETLTRETRTVTVVFPGVRVRCPKRAKPRGCRVKLQAVTKARRGRAESAVAAAKVRAGHSAIVSLKPKLAFADKLAAAKSVLVRETVSIAGSGRTRIARLKIVQ
jgi:YVTN family beta-propeller protein